MEFGFGMKPASSICALLVYLSIDQGRVADYYYFLIERHAIGGEN